MSAGTSKKRRIAVKLICLAEVLTAATVVSILPAADSGRKMTAGSTSEV